MVKNFVIKAFSVLLDIGFVIGLVGVVIAGLVTMAAGHGAQAFLSGLLFIVFGCLAMVLYFGLIYLLVDIRDILKSQSETRPFD